MKDFRVLALIAPMTQLNTPYPSSAYLTGFLRSQGVDARQDDLALKLVLRIFSSEGLKQVQTIARAQSLHERSASVNCFLDHAQRYVDCIEPVLVFLQGSDPTLAHRIATRGFIPEGPRFASLDNAEDDTLTWAFGCLGVQDRSRHLATLFLNDLADVLRDAVDNRFEFVRYGESLASSQASFDPLAKALAAPKTFIDQVLHALTLETFENHQPQLVLLSVPFPGTVYGALRMAQTIKQHQPDVKIVLGGGYVNTELRSLNEPRVFDFEFEFFKMERYRKLKVIGKGSFGYAVLVQSVADRQTYVMKIIDVSKMDRKQREDAINEVHVLKAMRHPYIITYKESFMDKRCLCIVMDYADGGDLYTKIANQKKIGKGKFALSSNKLSLLL